MRRVVLGVALALGLAAPPLPAQAVDLASLFPSQATIEAPARARLLRLELPAEVIGACRSDFSDLRIFDDLGREVPFVVESGVGAGVGFEAVTTRGAEILEARRDTRERERAPPLRRESYLLAAPPPPPAGGAWDLVLEVRASDFASRIEIRSAAAATTAIDAGAEPLAAGSIFRLREVGAEKTRLALPEAASTALLVSLETEGGAYLEPGFRYQSRRRFAAGADLGTPLEPRSTESDDGATVVVLERPPGLVPARLRLATSTPFFRRAIEVWDEGSGARREVLGRGLVFRVESAATVEQLELEIAPARGEALRLVIADGSSPPLADLRFEASLPGPALLFALPSATAADEQPAAATLYFGGGRAFRPSYDVAALPPPLPAAGQGAAVAEAIYDLARLPAARLGPISPNPRFDPRPVLEWAQRAGAALDPRLWSHRRPLQARPSEEGLSRLRLAIEDLGVARIDLADVRIVDREDRQWAYLIERHARRETRPLQIEGPRTKDRSSSWTLEPPTAPATADRLELEVPVPFFDRPYTLTATLDGDDRTVSTGRLVRVAGDPRPVLIALAETRFDRLTLAVEDGDDAPLELAAVEARFPVAEVYFAAPVGDYSLLVGYPEASAPSYELERARAVVLGVRSAPVQAGELGPNDAYSAGIRAFSGSGWQRLLLWGAILVLVAFLTVLTLRMARGGGAG